MFEPVKVAFGRYMGGFYNSLVPTTKGMQEFVGRGLEHSIGWAPGRMVDAAEDMIALWHRNDPNPENITPSKPANMPVLLCAMARDYSPTMRDYAYQIVHPQFFTFPDDAKERMFKLRTVSGDIRAQIVIFAHDEPTARGIAAQLLLYSDANRRFRSFYRFAGVDRPWPVQIEAPDSPAMNVGSESNNLTVLAVDFTLKVTAPLYQAPKDDEPHDGKGTDGNPDDPHGYLLVESFGADYTEAQP
jgi:hypothetical protein